MNKLRYPALLVAFAALASLASAVTVKIPEDKPAAIADVPDSWKPEKTDHGIGCESPDQVATVYLEATGSKGLDGLISENIDWLTKEQKVDVDASSQTTKDFKSGGFDWTRISWEGSSKEWGPSYVGFMFVDLGNGKVLTITYWITKKGSDKVMPALEEILDSIKRVDS
jgi:hypothetical protein